MGIAVSSGRLVIDGGLHENVKFNGARGAILSGTFGNLLIVGVEPWSLPITGGTFYNIERSSLESYVDCSIYELEGKKTKDGDAWVVTEK